MYSSAFTTLLADARIEELRRARGTSIRWSQSRDDRGPRAAARLASMSRAGLRRLWPQPKLAA